MFPKLILNNCVRPNRLVFTPYALSKPWVSMTLCLVHWLFFLRPLLVDNNYCMPGTCHTIWQFRDALTFICLFITIWGLAVTLFLAHFSCFQHVNFKNRLYPCCLIYPTSWHVLLWLRDQLLPRSLHCNKIINIYYIYYILTSFRISVYSMAKLF